jgi:hypothetical protein
MMRCLMPEAMNPPSPVQCTMDWRQWPANPCRLQSGEKTAVSHFAGGATVRLPFQRIVPADGQTVDWTPLYIKHLGVPRSHTLLSPQRRQRPICDDRSPVRLRLHRH